jgi:hypothetical protein
VKVTCLNLVLVWVLPHLTKVADKCYHQTFVVDEKLKIVHTIDNDTRYYGFRMIRNTDDTCCLYTPMAVSTLYMCNTLLNDVTGVEGGALRNTFPISLKSRNFGDFIKISQIVLIAELHILDSNHRLSSSDFASTRCFIPLVM